MRPHLKINKGLGQNKQRSVVKQLFSLGVTYTHKHKDTAAVSHEEPMVFLGNEILPSQGKQSAVQTCGVAMSKLELVCLLVCLRNDVDYDLPRCRSVTCPF